MTEIGLIILATLIFINLFSFIFSILMDEFTNKKIRRKKGKRYEEQKRRHK
jgi:hypothetical protein